MDPDMFLYKKRIMNPSMFLHKNNGSRYVLVKEEWIQLCSCIRRMDPAMFLYKKNGCWILITFIYKHLKYWLVNTHSFVIICACTRKIVPNIVPISLWLAENNTSRPCTSFTNLLLFALENSNPATITRYNIMFLYFHDQLKIIQADHVPASQNCYFCLGKQQPSHNNKIQYNVLISSWSVENNTSRACTSFTNLLFLPWKTATQSQ